MMLIQQSFQAFIFIPQTLQITPKFIITRFRQSYIAPSANPYHLQQVKHSSPFLV